MGKNVRVTTVRLSSSLGETTQFTSSNTTISISSEGVEFDAHGRANPEQRISTVELAQLAGITTEEANSVPDPSPGQDETLRDAPVELLSEAQCPGTVHGVLTLLGAWSAMGGRVEYGQSGETSCFLMARPAHDPRGSIWPVVLYPSGKCEVVFQHLATRAPFDDRELREELRTRLNDAPGVGLPGARFELRPGFDIAVLADAKAGDSITNTLAWFLDRSTTQETTPSVTTDL